MYNDTFPKKAICVSRSLVCLASVERYQSLEEISDGIYLIASQMNILPGQKREREEENVTMWKEMNDLRSKQKIQSSQLIPLAEQKH